LKALVISPNEKTVEFGCLLAVARAEARRREQSQVNPPVLALVFVAEVGVYVAVYEVLDNGKSGDRNSTIEKACSLKDRDKKSGREVS
jgi:hypothetical protein